MGWTGAGKSRGLECESMAHRADKASRSFLSRVLRRLVTAYGPRPWKSEGGAAGVLVGTILSQSTSHSNSGSAYRQLWRRFRNWDGVANAPVDEIERCIRVAGLSRQKAPRIKAILQQIRREHGRADLQFLADYSPQEAYAYLTKFRGVGPKTAFCVLMFSFGMPVFPVDTHILRIAIRLGVLDAGISAERAHGLLTPLIAPADRYAMHLLLIAHGRQICAARSPRCETCCLLSLCPFGQRAVGGSA